MAIKKEKHLKQKGIIQQSQPLGLSTPWKPNQKVNIEGGPSQPNKEGKAKYPREKKDILVVVKSNNVTPTSRNYDIKYFYYLGFGHVASQCPNKRFMVIKDNNEFETNGEDEKEKMTPLEDADDVCVENSVKGEALMVRKALNMHVKVDDLEGQKKNICHIRCHVQNKDVT